MSLSGDVGANVKAGTNKRIVWDVFMDMKKLALDVAVKITATQAGTNKSEQGIASKKKTLVGIVMVSIPGGSFSMGSNKGESDERPCTS